MENEKRKTNANKLNSVQKTIMAEFMAVHPSLAQNLITNCPQGKTMADGLWATLTKRLNHSGPPFKDAKAWKKVFADQKYQAKKKMSFNSTLKQKNYEEYLFQQKRISATDQQILTASGLKLIEQSEKNSSRGSSPVFQSETGTVKIKVENTDSVDSLLSLDSTDILDKDNIIDEELFASTHEDSFQSLEIEQDKEKDASTMNLSNTPCDTTPKTMNKETIKEVNQLTNVKRTQNLNLKIEKESDTLKFLNEYISNQSVFQKRIESKLDRLLDIEEKMLKIKEEKHKSVIALNLIKLEIKTLELVKLKTQ